LVQHKAHTHTHTHTHIYTYTYILRTHLIWGGYD